MKFGELRIRPLVFLAMLGAGILLAEDPPPPGAPEALQTARERIAGFAPSPPGVPAEERIQPWLRQLGHAEWKKREEATLELIQQGTPIKPLVLPYTRSRDPEIAKRARRVIANLVPPPDPPEAGDLLEASTLLLRAGDPDIPDSLIALLSHQDESIRDVAATQLRRYTCRDFGFQADAEPEERKRAASRWRTWRESHADAIPWDSARESVVVVCDPALPSVKAVDLEGRLLWEYAMDSPPASAWLRKNGHLLVAYQGSGRVNELDHRGNVVWELETEERIQGLIDIQELENGNLLLTDDPGGKVVELNREGKLVWEKKGLAHPHAAFRTANGTTWIAEHTENRVIEVDADGKLLRQVEDHPAVTDVTPAPGKGALCITRMGANPKTVHWRSDEETTGLVSSGLPITSAVLTPERVVVSVIEHRGVVAGPRGGRLRTTGVPRKDMWGKIRVFPREQAERTSTP